MTSPGLTSLNTYSVPSKKGGSEVILILSSPMAELPRFLADIELTILAELRHIA